MDKKFIHSKIEAEMYSAWEKSNFFKKNKGKKTYTILMPPPNANASIHAGHAMYVIDDIIIRWKLIQGYDAKWIPGTDHAGFETQYVYEKYLEKQGKSRLDFDTKTLYNNIYNFVQKNSGLIYKQFKRLGFLADWERSVFSLDDQVLTQVFETFKTMEKQGLVYRDNYIVNYCSHCGTTLAELEVKYMERTDPLYYIKYGPLTIATVRPETKFGDTALAVHPNDKRYKKYLKKKHIEVKGLLGKFKIKVIEDELVDPEFGTGVVKVTPAHDNNDFEMGKKHGLEVKKVIDWDGKLNKHAGKYMGLKVMKAREIVVKDMIEKGLIDKKKIDKKYTHRVAVCYKCGRNLEPTIIPNWFIKVDKLKKPVIQAVKQEKVKFYPKKYKKQMLEWLKIMHDWPISRQIVWGIRIPVWYKIEKGVSNIYVWWLNKNRKLMYGSLNKFLNQGIDLEEIEKGLQRVHALTGSSQPKYIVSINKPGDNYLPETDTFDTWFSSGQWPLVTLKKHEYKTRFPTDLLATLSDILTLWISRMLIFSLYLKQDVPFKNVYLWSMVADAKGNKMSKSKGNVIDPIEAVDEYGADALRASLVFGASQGGKIIFSKDKVKAMRNFANKVWNIGRFIKMNKDQILKQNNINNNKEENTNFKTTKVLKEMSTQFKEEKKEYEKNMSSYQFSRSFDLVYFFLWHGFADYYIEHLKEDMRNGNIEVLEALENVYFSNLKMLHPFMPFVTEALWKVFYGKKSSILNN